MDWIDQCLLYNYLGENIKELRLRGIRGSIEMSGLEDGEALNLVATKTLKIDPAELNTSRVNCVMIIR